MQLVYTVIPGSMFVVTDLVVILGYLYFTIYVFDNFYFYSTTFLKKMMYFLLHYIFHDT